MARSTQLRPNTRKSIFAHQSKRRVPAYVEHLKGRIDCRSLAAGAGVEQRQEEWEKELAKVRKAQ